MDVGHGLVNPKSMPGNSLPPSLPAQRWPLYACLVEVCLTYINKYQQFSLLPQQSALHRAAAFVNRQIIWENKHEGSNASQQ